MSSNSTAQELPNPYTPLAFLPPDLALKIEATGYVFVGALSAFIWDWLMSIPDEYRMIRNSRKLSLSMVAYFLSRIGTLGYCTTATVFQVGLVAHCQVLLYLVGGFCVVAVPATSMLFLFRVRAVYNNSKIITGFFSFLWVAILGTSILVPLAIEGEHLGPTQRCINTVVRSYGSTAIYLNAINDTLVFIAISVRIISHSATGTWRARFKSFFHGERLPQISKDLLQSGQLYYFATIGLSIATCAMLVAPGVPAVYHATLAIPNLALENSMACRVFRAVKLGHIKDIQVVSLSGTNFRFNPVSFGPENGTTMERHVFDGSRELQFSTNTTKTTGAAENVRSHHEYEKPVSLVKENIKTSDRV